jgi:hypothetical protein
MDRCLLMFAVLVLAIAAGAAEAQAGPLTIEATADGVKVQVADFQGTAQRVFYDETKGRLILEGRGDSQASLFRKRNNNVAGELIQGTRIIYSLKDGKCWVEGASRLSEP